MSTFKMQMLIAGSNWS